MDPVTLLSTVAILVPALQGIRSIFQTFRKECSEEDFEENFATLVERKKLEKEIKELRESIAKNDPKALAEAQSLIGEA
jgi:hypothetical protein